MYEEILFSGFDPHFLFPNFKKERERRFKDNDDLNAEYYYEGTTGRLYFKTEIFKKIFFRELMDDLSRYIESFEGFTKYIP
jgi:hypothetical protein